MAEKKDQPCIVVGGNAPMQLEAYPDNPTKVLCYGDSVTVFRNRRQARRAIERSRKYAVAHGFPWIMVREPYNVYIYNVVPS